MNAKNFSSIKNSFYILYICISAFFLMNDFKIVTLIMMSILAPTILFMEHFENNKTETEG